MWIPLVMRRMARRTARQQTRMRAADRGSQTVDTVLWIAVVVAVVGVIGALFRDAIVDYFNSLVFEIGFDEGTTT